jgi:CPA2 family monovalent cation:H+ antiporter-2
MHLPQLIHDLSIILGVAALVTILFRLIKQPVVLGYIVAGIIVGPYTPPIFSVVEADGVKVWAELGVIFLMFSLGLEFSFRRLAGVGISAGATAIVEVLTMIIWGYGGSRLLGGTGMDAIFLGCMIAISSTTIIGKTFEELGLKGRRFSELVMGIVIVEDLAAIVMLVALGNIASQAPLSSTDLLTTVGKLGLVVAAWIVIGMFVVPRMVQHVGRKGNEEMLIVLSLGLCLGLVSLAAYFHYSSALGAFIMGSILAETREVHRIETLMAPIKNTFGAIFFVSVGMLLDPGVLVQNLGSVVTISLLIIIGKILSVGLSALTTGQNLSTAVHAGMSMAQIGEFSFIIATLGLSNHVIDPKLYPIIVAASLVTTFATPYLVKAAPGTTLFLNRHLPKSILMILDRYGAWFQRKFSGRTVEPWFYARLLRWAANAITVVTIFVLSGRFLAPWLTRIFGESPNTAAGAWLVTFALASPFVWAMGTAFRRSIDEIGDRLSSIASANMLSVVSLLSRAGTILVVGMLSVEFFSVWFTVWLTVGSTVLLFVLFRHQIEGYYRWFEASFVSGFDKAEPERLTLAESHAHLVPWNARLVETLVSPTSCLSGKTLVELQLRERFGVNIVVIHRSEENLVAPKATERILPGDVLLCFGTDEELEQFQDEATRPRPINTDGGNVNTYGLFQVLLAPGSAAIGLTIRESEIRERFDCIVVGIERDGRRIQSPLSNLQFSSGDLIWIVGDTGKHRGLQEHLSSNAKSAVNDLHI